ncbi:hypothetical protein J6A64_07855 [bacterium]|nr:hypothetical protein [bacterium]MBO5447268.1 hypothetical protein [bacterium]
MKKLLLLAIAVTIPAMAQAAISVDQTTDSERLIRSGYSKQTADIVNVGKARATGQEYYTDDEKAFKKQNKFVRFWRKLYVYADPAAEDYSYYHHSTDTSPSYSDL